MTYSLGWSVIPQTVVRRERWSGSYKTRSVPLVHPGQNVEPWQAIIRIERLKAAEELTTAPHLSLPRVDLSPNIKSSTDASNTQRDSEILPAGLRGRVVDITPRGGVIIESQAAVLQGSIGAGKQVAGILTMWQASNAEEQAQAIPAGALLVVPGPLNLAMLYQALVSGIVGVIASSISSRDLEGFLRTDLIELMGSVNVEQAQAHLPPLTILFTEGLGTIAMALHTINLLSHYQGSIALLSGATSVRQRIFPELVISLPSKEVQEDWQPIQPNPAVILGSQVRVCSGEYEGAISTVTYLFAHEQVFLSGVRARAVRLLLEDGSMVTVPLMSVERIS
ncbi:MAG: hypothetical protein ACJ788_13225 [Ktedonobacteraceae bacterium]